LNRSANAQESLLTRNFILVCMVGITSFGGVSLLVPTLPFYVIEIGGTTADIGFVVAVFAAVSILIRPFAGRASDIYGSKLIMLVGGLVTLVSSALYLWPVEIPVFSAVRAFHGIGLSILSTGAFAYMADVAPPYRRGEAMGLFGMSMSLSFAVGPLFGSVIQSNFGFTPLFLFLVLSSLIALLFAYLAAPTARAGSQGVPSLSLGALINKEALIPGILLFCMATSFAPMATLLPLFAKERSLGDPGVYFFVQACSIFGSRWWAGSLSDKYGRMAVIVPSLLLVAVGEAVLGLSLFTWIFLTAAAIHGAGVGALQPTVLALAIDRADERSRGAAMATVNIFLDFGFAIGSLAMGNLAPYTGIAPLYLSETGVVLFGMFVFVMFMRREKRSQVEAVVPR